MYNVYVLRQGIISCCIISQPRFKGNLTGYIPWNALCCTLRWSSIYFQSIAKQWCKRLNNLITGWLHDNKNVTVTCPFTSGQLKKEKEHWNIFTSDRVWAYLHILFYMYNVYIYYTLYQRSLLHRTAAWTSIVFIDGFSSVSLFIWSDFYGHWLGKWRSSQGFTIVCSCSCMKFYEA